MTVLQTDLRALDEHHRQALKAREDPLAEDLRALEAERDQALGAAGVDTTALNRLAQEVNAVQTQLARIEQSRTDVSQWQLWQANDWPRPWSRPSAG